VRAIVLALVFAVMILYALRRPWAGILIWSWFSYMNPHRFAFGFAYLFPWVQITAAVTLLAWLASKEPKSFPWTRETVLEILLCVWITVTSFFALSDLAWDYWDRAIKVQVMIFMTLLIMRSRFRLEALVWTIVLSIGFFGVKGGIWTLFTGGHYHVQGPEHTFIEGNNEIGLAMVMVLPLMRYLQLQSNARWVRWNLVAAQILTALAILCTYSRGGFVALCVVGLLLWLKSRHKMALAIGIIVVGVPMLKFMPSEWNERMQTIETTDTEDMDASARGRLNAWGFAINLVEDRPLIGGGFRVFISPAFALYAPDARNRHDAHSIYFEVLGEHGIPGLLIFLGLGICTWLTARSVAHHARAIPELAWMSDMVSMVQVGLAGFAVGGAFAGLAFFDLPYHMMAIIVICKVLLHAKLRETRNELREASVLPSIEAVQTV
jgi:probable O-glycosylation ligase (exosortase A-associated)